jgi:hypothetical protein
MVEGRRAIPVQRACSCALTRRHRFLKREAESRERARPAAGSKEQARTNRTLLRPAVTFK